MKKKEYDLYLSSENKVQANFSKKSFRKDPVLRMGVHKKIESVLTEIGAIYEFCDTTVSIQCIRNFVSSYAEFCYDPMDYFMVDATKHKNVIYITDDTDFQSDKSINVLTI